MMALISRFALAISLLCAASAMSLAADRTIIVLDASGSMWGQIDGRPKLEIAREALRGVLSEITPDREIGLMAYGHRDKGSCEDIELVVPPAAGAAAQIAIAADNLKFIGKTPLSAAVKQAAEALKYTEEKATVVLITDGLETCNADPCALGRELKQSGVDFTAHVVGFGLTADEGRQVSCLAENTGGSYFSASDAEALKGALTTVVVAPPAAPPPLLPEPEPEQIPAETEFNFIPETVLVEGGEVLKDYDNGYEIYGVTADGGKGERITTEYGNYKGNLTPGDYIVRAYWGAASSEQKVAIATGKTDTTRFNLNAGTLFIHPRPAPGADVAEGAAVEIKFANGESETFYGDARVIVPEGEQVVTVRIGQASVTDTFLVKAGETVEQDMVVGVGSLLMNAFYTEGGEKVASEGVAFSIFKARKQLDGTRERLATTYGPGARENLPAGDYVVVAEMDRASAETAVTAKIGELVEANVVLEAGVLAITAPGASNIEIFAARKRLDGTRQSFGLDYTEARTATLPGGDYTIVATRGEPATTSEATATVKAGERIEVTVP